MLNVILGEWLQGGSLSSYKCLFSSKFVFFCNIVRSLPFPFSPMLRIKKPALNHKLIFISSMSCLYIDLVSYLSIYISFPQGFIHLYIYMYIYIVLHRYIQAFYPHLTTWQYNFKYVLHSCSLVKVICKSKSVSEEILFGGWRIHWGILITFFPVFWSTGPKISAHR